MPTNTFEQNREEFNKKVGAINYNSIAPRTREYAASRNNIGAVNLENLESVTEQLISNQTQTISSLSNDITSSFNELNKNLDSVGKTFSSNTDSLVDSFGELNEQLEKTSGKLEYVGTGLLDLGKFAAAGALVPAAAWAGKKVARTAWGTAKLGARAATAPVRVPYNIASKLGENVTEQAEAITGDVRSDIGGAAKRGLGLAPALAMGGPAGLVLQSLLFGGKKEPKDAESGGIGIGPKVWGVMKKSLVGMETGMTKFGDWLEGMPRSQRKSGIMNVSPSPEFEEQFTRLENTLQPEQTPRISRIHERFEKGRKLSEKDKLQIAKPVQIIPAPDEPSMQEQIKEGVKEGLGSLEKGFWLTNVFGGMFGSLRAIVGYALPFFGMGYRAELPNIKKDGPLVASAKTLGMIYVHSRFASDEANKQSEQLAKIMMAGFGIEGTIYRPVRRSMVEVIGGAIGDKLEPTFEKVKESIEKKTGLELSPRDTEFKKSAAGTQLDVLMEIRDILEMKLDIINQNLTKYFSLKPTGKKTEESAEVKPYMQGAEGTPYEITKTGSLIGHAGEIVVGKDKFKSMMENSTFSPVGEKAKTANKENQEQGNEEGKPKGFLGKMFGGIAGLFSGKLFKGITDKLAGMWETLKTIPDKIVVGIKDYADKSEWVKTLLNLPTKIAESIKKVWTESDWLSPMRNFFEKIKFDFEWDFQVALKKSGTLDAKGNFKKGSFWSGIFGALTQIPVRIKKYLDEFISAIGRMLNKPLEGEHAKSFTEAVAKAYQTLIPNIVKKTGGSIITGFMKILDDASKHLSKSLESLVAIGGNLLDYNKKIFGPLVEKWKDADASLISKLAEIPLSTVRVFTNLNTLLFGEKNEKIDFDSEAEPGKKIVKKGLIQNLFGVAGGLWNTINAIWDITWKFLVEVKDKIKEARKSLFEPLLPKNWGKFYKKAEDTVFKWSTLMYESINAVFGSIMGDEEKGVKGIKEIWDEKSKTLKKSDTKKLGLLGVLKAVGITAYAVASQMIDPIRSLLISFKDMLVEFKDIVANYLTGKASIFKDFEEFGSNIKNAADTINKKVKEVIDFSKGEKETPVPAMAKGGVVKAREGVGVNITAGEGGKAEVVIPLEDPKAHSRLIDWMLGAFEKMGFKKEGETGETEKPKTSFQDNVLLKLDKIIEILDKSIARLLARGFGFIGNVLGFGFDIATAPIRGAWGVGKWGAGGIWKRLTRKGKKLEPEEETNENIKETNSLLGRGFNAMISAIKATGRGTIATGKAAGRGVGWLGGKAIGGVKAAGRGVMAVGRGIKSAVMTPIDMAKNLIMSPFRKLGELKEKAKQKVKSVIGFAKGEVPVGGIDNEGQLVKHRWPTTIIRQLKTQTKLMKKQLRILGGDDAVEKGIDSKGKGGFVQKLTEGIGDKFKKVGKTIVEGGKGAILKLVGLIGGILGPILSGAIAALGPVLAVGMGTAIAAIIAKKLGVDSPEKAAVVSKGAKTVKAIGAGLEEGATKGVSELKAAKSAGKSVPKGSIVKGKLLAKGGKYIKGAGKWAGRAGGVLTAGLGGYEEYKKAEEMGLGEKQKTGSAIGGGLGALAGGMAGGAAAGAAIGTVIPVAGNIAGAIIGAGVGLAGAYFGAKFGQKAGGILGRMATKPEEAKEVQQTIEQKIKQGQTEFSGDIKDSLSQKAYNALGGMNMTIQSFATAREQGQIVYIPEKEKWMLKGEYEKEKYKGLIKESKIEAAKTQAKIDKNLTEKFTKNVKGQMSKEAFEAISTKKGVLWGGRETSRGTFDEARKSGMIIQDEKGQWILNPNAPKGAAASVMDKMKESKQSNAKEVSSKKVKGGRYINQTDPWDADLIDSRMKEEDERWKNTVPGSAAGKFKGDKVAKEWYYNIGESDYIPKSISAKANRGAYDPFEAEKYSNAEVERRVANSKKYGGPNEHRSYFGKSYKFMDSDIARVMPKEINIYKRKLRLATDPEEIAKLKKEIDLRQGQLDAYNYRKEENGQVFTSKDIGEFAVGGLFKAPPSKELMAKIHGGEVVLGNTPQFADMLKEALSDILSKGTKNLQSEVAEKFLGKEQLANSWVGRAASKFDYLTRPLEKAGERLNDIVERNNKNMLALNKTVVNNISNSAQHTVLAPERNFIDQDSEKILNMRLT